MIDATANYQIRESCPYLSCLKISGVPAVEWRGKKRQRTILVHAPKKHRLQNIAKAHGIKNRLSSLRIIMPSIISLNMPYKKK
jgi:hypothetical protein